MITRPGLQHLPAPGSAPGWQERRISGCVVNKGQIHSTSLISRFFNFSLSRAARLAHRRQPYPQSCCPPRTTVRRKPSRRQAPRSKSMSVLPLSRLLIHGRFPHCLTAANGTVLGRAIQHSAIVSPCMYLKSSSPDFCDRES